MSNQTADKLLKIKLECAKVSKEDFANLERWENEGGNAQINHAPFDELPKPLKPGQLFEVVDVEYEVEEGQCYFVARVNLVSTPL
jgi:hypothetical protein